MTLTIEFEQEADGRWIAEVPQLPGVLTYGETQAEAAQRAMELAKAAAMSLKQLPR